MATPQLFEVLQNYSPQCEVAVNSLINKEFYASYVFQAMGYFFRRDDMKLVHFSRYFLRRSREARDLAEKLMDLQVLRGARLRLSHIQKPAWEEWVSGLQAMEQALVLEKEINQSLLDLHKLASSLRDGHLCGFLESHFLLQKAEFIKELADYLSILRKMGAPEDAMSEYFFEQLILHDGDPTTEPVLPSQ